MTNDTIEMLVTRQTALTWPAGKGPAFAAPSPGSETAVLELPRGSAATMVSEAMRDKQPVEIDGRWFNVLSASIEINRGTARFWLQPTETR